LTKQITRTLLNVGWVIQENSKFDEEMNKFRDLSILLSFVNGLKS
jgi:hypothetical protein